MNVIMRMANIRRERTRLRQRSRSRRARRRQGMAPRVGVECLEDRTLLEGTIVSTFGTDGTLTLPQRVVSPVTGQEEDAFSVFRGADTIKSGPLAGRIVLGGFADDNFGTTDVFFATADSNGTPTWEDYVSNLVGENFGDTNRIISDLVARDNNGTNQVIYSGVFADQATVGAMIVNADGSLSPDPQFGNGGFTTIDRFAGPIFGRVPLDETPSGDIVISATVGNNIAAAVIDGTTGAVIDTETFDFGDTGASEVNGLAVSGTDIFFAGTRFGNGNEGVVVKTDLDLNLDQAFGTGGRILVGSNVFLNGVGVVPSGVVAVGSIGPFDTQDALAVKLDPATGALDNAFGNNGMAIQDAGGSDAWQAFVRDTLGGAGDDRVLPVGTSLNSTTFIPGVIGSALDELIGAVDTNFGNNGLLTPSIGGSADAAGVVSVPDGFLVFGQSDANAAVTKVKVENQIKFPVFGEFGGHRDFGGPGQLPTAPQVESFVQFSIENDGPTVPASEIRLDFPAGNSIVTGGQLFPAPNPLVAQNQTVPGDLNGDGVTNVDDLNLVLFNWNIPGENLPSEWVNNRPSGTVGPDELNAVMFNWSLPPGGSPDSVTRSTIRSDDTVPLLDTTAALVDTAIDGLSIDLGPLPSGSVTVVTIPLQLIAVPPGTPDPQLTATLTSTGNDPIVSDPVVVPVDAPPVDLFDVDGNGMFDLFTDGVLIVRYLAGFTGTALTENATAGSSTRNDPADVLAYLNRWRRAFDPDANGAQELFTDGIVLARHLAGFTGDALIENAVDPLGVRSDTASVEAFLNAFAAPSNDVALPSTIVAAAIVPETATAPAIESGHHALEVVPSDTPLVRPASNGPADLPRPTNGQAPVDAGSPGSRSSSINSAARRLEDELFAEFFPGLASQI